MAEEASRPGPWRVEQRDMDGMEGPGIPAEQDPRRYRILTALLFVAGLVGLATWAVAFDLRTTGLRVAWISPGWLLPAVMCLAFPFVVHGIRYKLMLDRMVQVSWGFVWRMVFACAFLNHFVVAKIGDFAEPAWLQQRTGLRYWDGLRIGLLRAAHSAVALSILAAVTVAAWSQGVGAPQLRGTVQVLAILVAVGAFAGALGFVVVARRHTDSWSPSVYEGSSEGGALEGAVSGPGGRWARLQERVRTLVVEMAQTVVAFPVRSHAWLIGLAVAEVSLDALPYLFFARACGLDLGPAPVLTASGALNVLEYLPTPPAMLGVQGWVGTLTMLPADVPAGVLAVSVAVHRTIRTLMIALVGAWPTWRLVREGAHRGLTRTRVKTRPGAGADRVTRVRS